MYSVTSPSVTVPPSVHTDLCPSLTLLHDHAKNVIAPVKSSEYFSTPFKLQELEPVLKHLQPKT